MPPLYPSSQRERSCSPNARSPLCMEALHSHAPRTSRASMVSSSRPCSPLSFSIGPPPCSPSIPPSPCSWPAQHSVSFPASPTPPALRAHPRAPPAGGLVAGVAPLFGFTAIALGLVGYVTTLFNLSAVLTIVWARVFLHEGQMRERLLGAGVMLVGGVLVAA